MWASKRGGIQLLTQEYEGRHCDVTITPWEGEENIFSSFAKMLKNVSITEFLTMSRVRALGDGGRGRGDGGGEGGGEGGGGVHNLFLIIERAQKKDFIVRGGNV